MIQAETQDQTRNWESFSLKIANCVMVKSILHSRIYRILTQRRQDRQEKCQNLCDLATLREVINVQHFVDHYKK
jgi:hypothetical protein